MKLFDVLGLHDPRIRLADSKIHLATHNGTDNPLRVYFEGKFDEWQAWQTKRNFSKPYVISLIQLAERNRWLFVGAYAAGKAPDWREAKKLFWYELAPLGECAGLGGRVVVGFERPGRASYLLGESFGSQMVVHELRPEPMHLEEFPGFKKVDLEWPDLEIVVRQNATS